MIAGIVLIALGIKKTIGHVDEPLKIVPAVALLGGVALYYGGHVGFRLRIVGTLNRQRLVAALVALAFIAAGHGDRRAAHARVRRPAHERRSSPTRRSASPRRGGGSAGPRPAARIEAGALHRLVTGRGRGRRTVPAWARGSGRLAHLVGRRPDYDELLGLLGQAGRNVERATALLGELMRSWPDGRERRPELVDVEHDNDAVTHDIIHHLHARLAVPFDPSDVLALASSLDDVVDYAEEAADLLGLYRVEAPMDQAIALADTLARLAPRWLGRALTASTTWPRPASI